MEQRWDPDVKRFFVRILNSISMGLLWLLACATAGLYFELGYGKGIYTILFYTCMAVSFAFLLMYLIRLWKSRD